MPDKEGSDDEKTTKGVVKKKKKQMMGEEGYDTYRDNILMRGGDHRSKETKEKSYTPSEQPKGQTAAQKAAKGKSALDLVKADITKKYGKGAIMDVKKKSKKKANEELDLTKIAEAFGGYLIEVEIKRDKSGTVIDATYTAAERASAKKAQEAQKEIFRKAAAAKKQKVTKLGRATLGGIGNLPDDEAAAQAAAIAQRDIATDTSDLGGRIEPDTKRAMRSVAQGKEGKRKLADTTAGGEVKVIKSANPNVPIKKPTTANVKTGSIPEPKPKRIRTIPFKRKPTYSPEVEKQIDRIKKEISQRDTKKKKDKDIRDIINPDKRKKPAYVSTSSPGFGEPETIKNYPSTPLTFTNRPKGVGDTKTGLRRSFKDFGQELDSYGDRLKAFRKDFDKIKPQKDRVIVDQDPSNEIKKTGRKPKKEEEPTTDTDGVGTVPPGRTTITTSDDRGKGKNSIVSLTRKALKNPALTFLTFDTLRKYLPSASPFGIKGGRVGSRSAPS